MKWANWYFFANFNLLLDLYLKKKMIFWFHYPLSQNQMEPKEDQGIKVNIKGSKCYPIENSELQSSSVRVFTFQLLT